MIYSYKRKFLKLIFLSFLWSGHNLFGSNNSFSVTFSIISNWNTGYQAAIIIKNNGSQPTSSWNLAFNFATSDQVFQMNNGQPNVWGGVFNATASSGTHVVMINPSWVNGGLISPGGSCSIGMIVNKNVGSSAGIQNIVFTPVFSQASLSVPVAPVSSTKSSVSGTSQTPSTAVVNKVVQSGTSATPIAVPVVPVIQPALPVSTPVQIQPSNPPVSTTSLTVAQYTILQNYIAELLEKTEAQYNSFPAVAGLLVDDSTSTLHSEGIGYGMLIALGNNDQPTFLKNINFMAARLDNFGLMNWNANTNGTIVAGYNGHYAAADADQDIAYALIQGIKKWPALATQTVPVTVIGYNSSTNSEMAPVSSTMTILDLAKQQIYSIWDLEVSQNPNNQTGQTPVNLILPGDGFGGRPFSTGTSINVSYFRPTYMQAFQTFYTTYLAGNTNMPPLYNSSGYKSGSFTYASQIHNWSAVKTAMYNYILLNMKNSNVGLPSGWSSPVTGVPGGGDMNFQYDAVRVLQFVGMDYIQSGNVQAKQILEQILGYYCSLLQQSINTPFPLPVTLTVGTAAGSWVYPGTVFPPVNLSFKSGNCNPSNPMIAEALMIAAHAIGSSYQTLEQSCYDYLMSITNIPYFAGALTVMSAQFLTGVYP